MIKFLAVLALIAWNPTGSLAGIPNRSQSEDLMDYVAANQDEWNSSEVIMTNDTRADQNKIQIKLTPLQESLNSLELKDEWKKIILEGFEEKLGRTQDHLRSLENKLESMQTKIDSQLTAIQESLSVLYRKVILSDFERIGTRYFHIHKDVNVNWADAQLACYRMGGHLASFQNREEFEAIVAKLDNSEEYFLGINDRAKKGDYVSVASGKRASFFSWYPNEPHSNSEVENCVAIKENKMFMGNCNFGKSFICQSDDEI